LKLQHPEVRLKMKNESIESVTGSYEEIFLDHEIYIEPNRDPYRGGYEWSVCKGGVELDAGLQFAVDDALSRAKEVVATLTAGAGNAG
jgi:hypothetical protein